MPRRFDGAGHREDNDETSFDCSLRRCRAVGRSGRRVGAAGLPGSFPGVTIDAKLIGGQQYEPLYARIAEWEKLTGAKVNIISKKNGFDLDKELKSDIAAGTD